MIQLSWAPGGILRKGVFACMVVLGLALYGVPGAAAPPDSLKTNITVDQEARTLSVTVRDRVLTVAVLEAGGHDNPVIDISGWGREERFELAVSESAPVIFIDLYDTLPGFKTAVLPVDTGWVSHLRLGHHVDRLRIAIDGTHSEVPQASVVRREDGLVITLDSEKQRSAPSAASDQNPLMPVVPAIESTEPEIFEPTKPSIHPIQTSHIIRQALGNIKDPVTTPESRLFQDAISLFDNRQWDLARNKVQQIINQYPQSPYAEKARFLLIDILQGLYENDPAAHFRELVQHFQDVLNRYPGSSHKGIVLLGLARLHRRVGNHAEALAYYELARNSISDEDGWIVRQAMLDTAKIYRATNRMSQALIVLEDIKTTTSHPAIQNEAQLEIAKIRYDQNFFNESLTLLKQLISRDKAAYFQYPDVALYLGNNYFQMGRYELAAMHLLHYYNTVPETLEKDMILARVGDAFLQDGKVMDAVRYFQFVVDRYPDSRGAAVSWLRLAEQKEKYPDDRIPVSYSAKQVYENIRDSYQDRPINDSLALLAILKLAMLYQEEQHYSQSLETLRLFFDNHPDGSLRENGRFAMKSLLEDMIREAYANKDYDRVIMVYQKEARSVLPLMDMDSIHLMVARAYHHSGNPEAALAIYQQLGASMSLEDMPDDVLYVTGKALFESGRTDIAEQRFSRLISAYPQTPYAGDAMNLMGQILMADEKFEEAVAIMTRALSYPFSPCDRAGLLVRKARAAWPVRDMENTLSALDSARETLDQCPALAGYLGDQVGDLYFQAGYFDQAGSVYTHVLGMADSQVEPSFLQYKTALSLWRSGKREQGLVLFETLAAQNDPFWSPLAREHLASAVFDKTVR